MTELSQGEQFTQQRVNLQEIFGSQWQEKCVSPSLAQSLEKYGLQKIEDAKVVALDEGEDVTRMDPEGSRFSALCLIYNRDATDVRVFTDREGKEKYIVGRTVGKDKVYAVTGKIVFDSDLQTGDTQPVI
ncbi:MAG: hypothetical protein WCO78_04880 [Candidatus Roizmanbacteria bacterium]